MLTLKLLRLGLLFIAPFVVYGGWLAIARRRAKDHPPGWDDAPLIWLSTSGLALVIGGLIWTAVLSGEDRDGTYVPARFIDGELVPGEIVSTDPAP
jgi:hypothetical protein